MNCPACHAEVPEGSKFCSECGEPASVRCASCGATNRPKAKFCAECGQRVGEGARAPADSIPPSSIAPRDERRQLAVMFADLVASTELAAQLDPEDLRHLVLRFQDAARRVIETYEGHIAQFLGDGILVYFGFPRAHDDDAQRAVLAGLGIVAAVQELNPRIREEFGRALSVRVGIHTGPTVVGALGNSERLAIGPTPNIAARLQALAEPDTVVISDATLTLVGSGFEVDDLGPQMLKGIDTTTRVWRVRREASGERFVDTLRARSQPPMYGREREFGALLGLWGDVTAGRGKGILIRGDAGIGKSRLVSAFLGHVDSDAGLLAGRCSPFRSNSPLSPLREMLTHHFGLDRKADVGSGFSRLRASLLDLGIEDVVTASLLATFLDVGTEQERSLPVWSPQIRLQRTLAALWQVMCGLARRQPLVLFVDDVHWIDQTTLDFLADASHNVASEPMLLMMTSRSRLESSKASVVDVPLSALPHSAIEKITQHLVHTMTADMVEKVKRHSDGNPLFAEELTRMLFQAAVSSDAGARAASAPIPDTLRNLLAARLDQLTPTAKALVQLCSAIGRSFSGELLDEVVRATEPHLASEVRKLAETDLITAHGPPGRKVYSFRHALLQEAAYEGLPRRIRAGYHGAVARALETQGNAPHELLAHHLTGAGEINRAVDYWHRAGQAALGAFGLREAKAHLEQGLSLLGTLPESAERTHSELALRVTLGAPIMLTTGFASSEVNAHNEVLWRLCSAALGPADAELRFAALWSMWTVHEVSGSYGKALEVAQTMLELAEASGQSIIMLAARTGLGAAYLMRGELDLARSNFEQSLQVYVPEEHRVLADLFGQDCAAMSAAFLTWVRAHDGDLDAGRAAERRALEICAALGGHPGTRGFVECVLASNHNLLGDYAKAAEYAESVTRLGQEQGMPHWAAQGAINLGWSLAGRGQCDSAVELIQGGIAGLRGVGTGAAMCYFHAALAEAELGRGRLAEARSALDAAHAHSATGEHYYDAEIHRLRARILLAEAGPGARDAAVVELNHAIVSASKQGARRFAQLAANELASLTRGANTAP